MDFTLEKYARLLDALKARDFASLTLRHDVDARPGNSLRTARMEAERGIYGIYYFRAVPGSWDEEVIRAIRDLGHEIGYHYESLTTCKGNVDAAYRDFCRNLARLRSLAPVRSICMHGSPLSPWDSRAIWEKYDYHSLGIDCEPYLDTDFSEVFYLTDTGRRWDGYNVSVRDRIAEKQQEWVDKGLVFHTTDELIAGMASASFPGRLMLTLHPQRWNPFGPAWLREWALQGAKNAVKRMIIKMK